MIKLDPHAARRDLTDRECAKLLGGEIGCLLGMATAENVIRAVTWWSEHADEIEKLEQSPLVRS